MGKRKKVQKVANVVKIDVDNYAFGGGEVVPILVQQSSKDGRRIKKAVHKIPTPRQDPLHSTFNPSPSFENAQDHTPHDLSEPMDERGGPERVSPCFLSSGHILTRTFTIAGPSADILHGAR